MKNQFGYLFIGFCILAAAFVLKPEPEARFALVQRESNRMVLLDSKTGQFWDVPPNRVGAEPVIDGPKLELR